ncbi:hypothetical protein [Nocardioides speluncae]|uniref:hypothetical protein n=1 Tax=Nocardioides speluncae TaxID=2670337 RepID=UPI0014751FF6|nr:hypothetical protein [Nocardioides speluncae]
MPDPHTDTERLPRWVKITGLTIAILAILGVLMMTLIGGGEHGPGRHAPGRETPSSEPPGHTPPAGGH